MRPVAFAVLGVVLGAAGSGGCQFSEKPLIPSRGVPVMADASAPARPQSTQLTARAAERYRRAHAGIDNDDDGGDNENLLATLLLLPPRATVALARAALKGPAEAYEYARGDTPTRAVRMMTDPVSADNRRLGINRLLDWDFAKREPFVTRYRYIAQNDRDQTVRAAAIRALNRCRDRSATPIFVKSLSDKNDLVKLESAKALANLPDPAAAEPLAALVSSPETNLDVRVAATDALKYYRTLPVARALSGVLGDRDFGVAWQARRSLQYLTGRDYRYDEAAWLAYFSGPDKPL